MRQFSIWTKLSKKGHTTQQSNENFGAGPLFETIRISQQRVKTLKDSIEVAILECLS